MAHFVIKNVENVTESQIMMRDKYRNASIDEILFSFAVKSLLKSGQLVVYGFTTCCWLLTFEEKKKKQGRKFIVVYYPSGKVLLA